jgi:hypothetical protein
MPRARLLASAQASGDIRADIERVDIARVALVHEPAPALSGAAGEARVLSDEPGRIVVETNADGRQLLTVSERFHGGWQVSEDGRLSTPLAVDGDYLGTVVDAGHHQVEFRFAPASARTGLRATLAGLALTLVATAILW